MLKEKFEIWLADPISNVILIILGMYITNRSYLKNRSSHFTKVLNNGREKFDRTWEEIDNAITISNNNNNKYLLDLPNLEVE